jgi:hypothetical protein
MCIASQGCRKPAKSLLPLLLLLLLLLLLPPLLLL